MTQCIAGALPMRCTVAFVGPRHMLLIQRSTASSQGMTTRHWSSRRNVPIRSGIAFAYLNGVCGVRPSCCSWVCSSVVCRHEPAATLGFLGQTKQRKKIQFTGIIGARPDVGYEVWFFALHPKSYYRKKPSPDTRTTA